jgi:HlyD family secretion protein
MPAVRAFLSVLAVLSLASLAAPSSFAQNEDAAKAESRKADVAKKRAALLRDAAVAKSKLGRADQDLADQEADNASALSKAATEVEFAKKKLATFDEREAPARVAKAKLDLKGVEDGVKDAEDELAQLEMMYKNSEIGDGTKEMVLQRARRALERAKARRDLGQNDLKTLEERTVPFERGRLALDVAERERDLERAKRAAEKTLFDKRLAKTLAENEAARLADELAALEDAK